MYAYIDETGNTGLDIFNEMQPFFMNLAVMSEEDIAISYQKEFNQILSRLQIEELHGKKLQSFEVYDMASKLLYNFLLNKDINFTYTFVDKELFSITILYEALFDSGINEAVPWHSYNLRELRLILLLNFIVLIQQTQNVHKRFWNECIFGKDISKADTSFISCLNNMLSELTNINLDKRSIEIFYDAIFWAKKNYEQFEYRIIYNDKDKKHKNIYLPTYCFFISLVKNIQQKFINTTSENCYLIHDRQQEYQKIIELAHSIISNPEIKGLYHTISYFHNTEIMTLPTSSLTFVEAKKNIGIQLSDFCASILSKKIKGKKMTLNMTKLYELIQKKTTTQYIFTYDALYTEIILFEKKLQQYESQLEINTYQKQIQNAKKIIAQEKARIDTIISELN